MTTRLQTGVTRFETSGDTDVVITRVIDAPRELAFDLWTKPEHLQRWMTGPVGWTMPVCEVDLRPGGRWRFVWNKAGASEMAMEGEYREVVRPERLVHVERWGPAWPETTNTLVFTEQGDQTIMVLTVAYPSRKAREAALNTGMKGGMDQSYANLDALVAELGA